MKVFILVISDDDENNEVKDLLYLFKIFLVK